MPLHRDGLVILIEDDIAVADASGILLEAEGYRVAAAASITEARAVLQRVGGELTFTPPVGRKNCIGVAKQPIGKHDASRPG